MQLVPTEESHPDTIDEGREIVDGDRRIRVAQDGMFDVEFEGGSFNGLLCVEDLGDRGDTYDFDPVEHAGSGGTDSDRGIQVPTSVAVSRGRHPGGIQWLRVTRTFAVSAGLTQDRSKMRDETKTLTLTATARLLPSVSRIDLHLVLDNTSEDHRLRIRFPTGNATRVSTAATTFAVAERSTAPRDGSAWIPPAPDTFPHHGCIAAGRLCVAAPGLPEAEVTPDGTLFVTLVRSVGWLSRPDLGARPGEAGPALETPAAQMPGSIEASLSLLPALSLRGLQDFERGLRAIATGPGTAMPEGRDMIRVEPDDLIVSALKPADDGSGLILRLLNPTGAAQTATIHLAPSLAQQLATLWLLLYTDLDARSCFRRDRPTSFRRSWQR